MPPASASELYILPGAFEEIKAHIDWRKASDENRYEQGGILIGDVYRDPARGITYGLVRGVIPSPRSGDETYIQFTQESWLEMYKALDRKKAATPDGGQMRLLGWYHTHPNMRVVMSNVDQNTHRQFFSKYWQFSVIFNPQRGIWSVFNGPDCFNCRGKLFCPQADYERKPYIAGAGAFSANREWYNFPQDYAGYGRGRENGGGNYAGYGTGRENGGGNYAGYGRGRENGGGNYAGYGRGRENGGGNYAGYGTRGAENNEEPKTFRIMSPLPPSPAPQPSPQPDATPAHRPQSQRKSQNTPSVPRGNVIKNAVQKVVNAVAPPDGYIYSKRLYQPADERMMVIPRALVEELIQKTKLPNYLTEQNELILLYPLKFQNQPFQYEGEPYYLFENCDGNAIKATGFWYMTESGQYAEYMEREQPSERANLAVVYSNQPVNEDKLRAWHEVSDLCQCVLWVNLINPKQSPPFYSLPKLNVTHPLSPRFPRKPGCGALYRSEDMLGPFSARAQSDWIYSDDSTDERTNQFKISPHFIQRLFEQFRCAQMRDDCCVAVTYGVSFDPTDKSALVLRNEPFLSMHVFSFREGLVDTDAQFYNTTYPDSAKDGTPKFVFLFSGGKINLRQLRYKLFGRDSALLLNIEDAQRFRICRVHG